MNSTLPDVMPNVLVFLSHDIGLSYGCYGDPTARTLTVDALASEGIVFGNHFCHYPLCGPSRANMFTGLEPPRTGRFDNRHFFASFRRSGPSGFQTLPECFVGAGYTTRAFGLVYHDDKDLPSWNAGHTTYPDTTEPGDEQYDVPLELLAGWRNLQSKELVQERCRRFLQEGIRQEELTGLYTRRRVRGPAVEAADVEDSAYHDGKVARDAAAWIKDYAAKEPFLVVCGFVAAHTPFRAPRHYWDIYNRSMLKLPEVQEPPEGSPAWVGGDSEPAQYYTQNDYDLPWRASREQSLELLHGRLATVSYIDAQIGVVLESLSARGLDDNTIVIVVSDHGFSEGHHGYWGKHNMWDRSLHTPLIVRLPAGIDRTGGSERPWRRITSLSAHVDLYPTLCDLCGIAVPEFLEGRSLVPLISSESELTRDHVTSYRKPHSFDREQVYSLARSIRTPRFRYTEYLDREDILLATELFDYEKDPDERTNRSANTDYRTIVTTLRQKLRIMP